MATDSPLRVQLEPGEYQCTWVVPVNGEPDRRLDGVLELLADRPPRGSVHGAVPIIKHVADGSSRMDFPQCTDFPVLRGELVRGDDVLLVDATVTVFFPGQAVVDARAALVGRQAGTHGDDLFFRCAKLQIEHLDSLNRRGPLGSYTLPKQVPVHLDATWSITGNPDSSQEWSDDEAKVQFSFDGSMSLGDGYGFHMDFSPVVVVETSAGLTFDQWLAQWVEPLRRLVCLATARQARITYFALELDSSTSSAATVVPDFQRLQQVYGYGLTQAPFTSDRSELSKHPSVVAMGEDDVSLLGLLRSWQALSSAHHPLLETYGNFAGESQHPRSHYLLLVQALEGLHGYETRSKYEERAAHHTMRREQILLALQAAVEQLDPQDSKWLERNLSKRPPAGLDEALHRSITTPPVDLSSELTSTALVQQVMRSTPRVTSLLPALRQIRNDLAHGNRGYDVHDLQEVAHLLERITRAHLLRVLGCAETVQRRCLTNNSAKAI